MPRRNPIKSALLEISLFVTLLALVGHVSVNFWERFIIQTELLSLKNNLNTLKNTINHVSQAYVQLYSEIQTLSDNVTMRLSDKPVNLKEGSTYISHCPANEEKCMLEDKTTQFTEETSVSGCDCVQNRYDIGIDARPEMIDMSMEFRPMTKEFGDSPLDAINKKIKEVLNITTAFQSNVPDVQNIYMHDRNEFKENPGILKKSYNQGPKNNPKNNIRKPRPHRTNRKSGYYCSDDPNDTENYCFSKF